MKWKPSEGDGELAKWPKSWYSLEAEAMESFKGIVKHDVVMLNCKACLFRFLL